MNLANDNSSGGGVGLCTLMFLLFLGLKLGHVIDWSWLWVCAPLWIPFLLVLPLIAMAFWARGQ